MSRESYITLLEVCPIRIVEVSYGAVHLSEEKEISLHTSAYIFCTAEKGHIQIQESFYRFKNHVLAHGKRGSSISLKPQKGWLEYFVLSYQQGSPFISRKEFMRLLENEDPFESIYVLTPSHPILLKQYFEKIYEAKKSEEISERIHAKALFYNIAKEAYEDIFLRRKAEIDPYLQVKTYIETHYHEPVSIQSLTQSLGLSGDGLNKIFHREMGKSPQAYLMHVRLERALTLMRETSLSITDIAMQCGFFDKSQFHRKFKQEFGQTPNQYRQTNTTKSIDLSIEILQKLFYNDEVVSLSKRIMKGEETMFKNMDKKKVLALLAAGMLALCACEAQAAPTPKEEKTNLKASEEVDAKETSVAESTALTKEFEEITINNFNRLTTYQKAPERVISLSYANTEILTALGLSDRIVGIATAESAVSDCLPIYQEEISKLNKITEGIGEYGVPSLEVVLSLTPDFVYGSVYSFGKTGVAMPEDFDKNKINIYASKATYTNGATMEDVYEDILNLGRIFDVNERATEIVTEMKQKLEMVSAQLGQEEKINVFVFDSGEDAPFTAGMSLESDLLSLAGTKNVFDNIPKQFAKVSWEDVVQLNPEVIVVHKWDDSDDVEGKIAFLKNQPQLLNVTAVKEDRFVILSLNSVFPSIQNPDVVIRLAQDFHPEKFK